MQKRILSILGMFLAGIAAVCLLGITVLQAESTGRKPNPRKGKYLYRKNCRSCHKAGGSANSLSPISKTQAEWEKVFKEYKNLKCAAEWEKVSKQDLEDIYSYLHDHAKDSPNPITCK